MSDYVKVPSKGAGQSDTLITVNDDKKGAEKPAEEGGICGPWKWFMAKPWKRWHFLIFLAFGVLTVLWLIMYVTSGFTGYLMSGIAAILLSLYGAQHFRELLGLKEEVDQYSKNNQTFRAENAKLLQAVDKLHRTRTELTGTEQNLKKANQKSKDNLKTFQEFTKNLQSHDDLTIKGLDKFKKSSEELLTKWKEDLITHEKEMLSHACDGFNKFQDDKPNMSKDEFTKFIHALPQEYQDQFAKLDKTFEEIAGDDDFINYDEFTCLVDQWVEDIALGNEK